MNTVMFLDQNKIGGRTPDISNESERAYKNPATIRMIGTRTLDAVDLILKAAANMELEAAQIEKENRLDKVNEWLEDEEHLGKTEWLMDHPDYMIYAGPELESELKAEEEEARLNTMEYENNPERSGITMLVCAQHPLNPDGTPDKIYKARLDEALFQYERYSKNGEDVIFRIPGAVHKGDNISLAESGKNYLIEHGIPEEKISADGSEENGTDEITNAFSIFEQSQSRQLHVVCSENQVVRNKLACISLLGMLPYFHTATVMDMKNSQELGFEIANPRGALRFKKEDKGVSVDSEAKNRHING